MKKNEFLFLFFYMLCAIIFAFSANAQSKADSANYYYNLILNPHNSSDIPSGIKFYINKKENHLSSFDTLKAIVDLRMIAIGQFKIGDIYDSENTTVEALVLIDNSKKKDTLIEARVGLYNQLGRIYRSLKNYEKAIQAYDNALKISKNQSDSISLLNNKATIFKDKHQYKKAMEQLTLAYPKKPELVNPLQLASLLDNIGLVQSKLNDPEALSSLIKALQIREDENNLTGIYSSYKNLAGYYFERKNDKQALLYANKAFNTAENINSITFVQDALSLYVMMNKDPKVVEYKNLTDSIAKEKQLAQNKNAFMKYNIEKERKKTIEAQLQQEKEKRSKLFYQAIGVLVLLGAISIFFILRTRFRKEKLKQVYITETRISKKVHDEVANAIYHVMSKIQGQKVNDNEVLDDLEHIYTKTRDISKESSALEVNMNFDTLINDLLVSYKNETVTIITRNISKIDWKTVPEIKKITLYRVLQELMTNMKKHSNATLVALTFNHAKKKITVEYSDNGVGCTIKKHVGLQNAENRIKTIKGTIIFDSQTNRGFKTKIIV